MTTFLRMRLLYSGLQGYFFYNILQLGLLGSQSAGKGAANAEILYRRLKAPSRDPRYSFSMEAGALNKNPLL